jgi:uncharacterized membrane protein YoaK (UPF0700 family)
VETLPPAVLLAFAGGSLDAFLYFAHNHVFAGAMTGNAVLAGIAMLSRDSQETWHHLLPIAAFLMGVWLAEVLQTRLQRHAVTVGLVLEAVGLTAAAFLPGNFPELIFAPAVALLAAFQVTSFRTVDSFSYNSTFITGNLREMVMGIHAALDAGKRKEGLRKARDLGLIALSFVAGAVSGAMLAARLHNRTLLLPVAVLLVTLAMVSLRERRLSA